MAHRHRCSLYFFRAEDATGRVVSVRLAPAPDFREFTVYGVEDRPRMQLSVLAEAPQVLAGRHSCGLKLRLLLVKNPDWIQVEEVFILQGDDLTLNDDRTQAVLFTLRAVEPEGVG